MKIDLCTLEHRRRTIGARNSISNKKKYKASVIFLSVVFFHSFFFLFNLFSFIFPSGLFLSTFFLFFSVRLPFFRPMFFDAVCSFFLSALFSSFFSFFSTTFYTSFFCMFFRLFFGFFISFFCHYFFSHIFFLHTVRIKFFNPLGFFFLPLGFNLKLLLGQTLASCCPAKP